MTQWITIRKGGAGIYLEYGHTSTGNLYAYNSEILPGRQFGIRLDLEPNLRKRNRQTSQYLDARQLADGAMQSLSLLQCHDIAMIDGIYSALDRMGSKPDTWTLHLLLDRHWSFVVRPEVQGGSTTRSLFLRVVSAGRGHAQDSSRGNAR